MTLGRKLTSRRLIVVGKYPLPGRVKSRLATAIGEKEAAGVYARILFTILLEIVRANLPGVALELSVASPADVPFFVRAFPEFAVRPQPEGDLGRRLAGCFEAAFSEGCQAVVTVASDTPGLDPALIRGAFDALEQAPLAVGPSSDGGYYLLGMRAPGAPLFSDVDWGSESVLAQTEALAKVLGLRMVHLPERFDVDTVEDLDAWREILRGGASNPASES
jgi:rSAM/selenodomain-associated transferase 1